MKAFAWLLLLPILRADALTDKMTARISEEAAAFIKIAPDLLGTEILHQRALKPPSRFHPRTGAAAAGPAPDQWIERDVVSEYGFAIFSESAGAVHELRQVISVDGKKVAETKKAQDSLAKAITGGDDEQKRAMLKEFQARGLAGAATDFGQVLLLFMRRDLERYEFTARPPMMIGYDRALVWSYKQIDGPEALTLFERSKMRRMRVAGEIRVRDTDFLPLQITLVSQEGDAPKSVREEAAVTYKVSQYGVLLPSSTEQRELRGGRLAMENRFTYSDFHRFGASSGVTFPANQ
jgi:hypothetical protein